MPDSDSNKKSIFKRLSNVLSNAVDETHEAVSKGKNAVTDTTDNITETFYTSADNVRKMVRGARNLAADITRTSGAVTGLVGGIAGEVFLISAGGFPYLLFGGEAITLGSKLSELCDSLSQTVRGDVPQFIGIDHVKKTGLFGNTEKIYTILYDPRHPDADSAGFIKLDEMKLNKTLPLICDGIEDSEAVYMAAYVALQHAKKQLGIAPDCADVTSVADEPNPQP